MNSSPTSTSAEDPSPENIAEVKRRLRAEAIERRSALSPDYRAQASAAITHRALDLIAREGFSRIAAYCSFGAEVATWPLIERLAAMNADLCLPRMTGEGRALEVRRVRDPSRGLVANRLGIHEPDPAAHPDLAVPADLELVLMPGLAFDRDGGRLGYGRGYYDRLLATAPGVYKLGLAFHEQLVPSVPTEPHDIRLDAIVTESETILTRA